MATGTNIQIQLSLEFPKAGIGFDIQVQNQTFELRVTNFQGTVPSPFTIDVSPELADWVRGYTRWLYRAKLQASFTENCVKGNFAQDTSSEDILKATADACEMIHQRFDQYESQILR